MFWDVLCFPFATCFGRFYVFLRVLVEVLLGFFVFWDVLCFSFAKWGGGFMFFLGFW